MRLVGVVPATALVRGGAADERLQTLAHAGHADLLEVRLDLGLDPRRLPALDLPVERPVLATVRSRAEGGGFDGTPDEAAAALRAAANAGAAWVDVEAGVAPLLHPKVRASGVRVLASQHGTGPLMLPRDGVDAWKVARPVRDAASLVACLREARDLAASSLAGEHPPAFLVPYGSLGAGLRVVTAAIAQGAGLDPFVFGRLGRPAPEADGADALSGVPLLSDLVDHGRLGEVSGGARLYGLVGRPPSRSPSPALHNAVFRALGLDAVYLPAADLDPDAVLELPYAGFSVTTPLKEEMARRCDSLDSLAAACGAVNTVVRGPTGRLRGANTDAIAIQEAVRDRGPRTGTALVLGGGGFARAAASALRARGLTVRLVGASERTRRAASALGIEACGDDRRPRESDVVVVNATPIGAGGEDVSAWAAWMAALPPQALFLDGPYAAGGAPAALAVAARARGLAVEHGGLLLVRQAVAQAALFVGRAVAPEIAAVAAAPRCSVVLVGPRGAGKTNVGRALAAGLGRPFVDTDDALARRAGRPAGHVLAERGEAAFRALEAREALRALERRGAVIALGGGALESDAVLEAVRLRGHVVRLTVAPEEAARRILADSTPRPRLTDAGDLVAECVRLADLRAPRYEAAAQVTIATDGKGVDEVVGVVRPIAVRAFVGP